MSPYKVNYSELVTALQDHKHGAANALLRKLLPRLKMYLMVVMEATPQDADEAVHNAFLNTLKKIMKDEITKKDYIYKYLLKACRHEYLRYMEKQKPYVFEDDSGFEDKVSPAEQINNLMDEERQIILKECLQELPEESRNYINYILIHPTISTKGLSEHFDISESNARVKKSRIINDLSHCVKKKWNK